MRINFFLLFISLIVGGLIFYGLYTASENTLYSAVASALAFVMLSATLAIRSKDAPRSSALVKLVSGIFFVVILILNVLLIFWNVAQPAFVITNGLALCLWAVLAYAIGRTHQ